MKKLEKVETLQNVTSASDLASKLGSFLEQNPGSVITGVCLMETDSQDVTFIYTASN